jgi:hypothetical protein
MTNGLQQGETDSRIRRQKDHRERSGEPLDLGGQSLVRIASSLRADMIFGNDR